MSYFDGHAHLQPNPESKARLLAAMDAHDIHRAAVVAGGVVSPYQLARNMMSGDGCDIDVKNEELRELCSSSAGRLLPFFFANPHRGDAPYLAAGKDFCGLKLGPAVHGVALTDPRTFSLIEVAASFQHPVYLHCLARPGFDVAALVSLAASFPKVSFILGHAGIGNCDFHAIGLIEPHRNTFFETSGGFGAVIEEACRRLGCRRVIFGTEYPLQFPSVELEKIRCLTLSREERFAVLGGNIEKLLKPKEKQCLS